MTKGKPIKYQLDTRYRIVLEVVDGYAGAAHYRTLKEKVLTTEVDLQIARVMLAKVPERPRFG